MVKKLSLFVNRYGVKFVNVLTKIYQCGTISHLYSFLIQGYYTAEMRCEVVTNLEYVIYIGQITLFQERARCEYSVVNLITDHFTSMDRRPTTGCYLHHDSTKVSNINMKQHNELCNASSLVSELNNNILCSSM